MLPACSVLLLEGSIYFSTVLEQDKHINDHEDDKCSGSPCSVLFSNMNPQVVPLSCTQDLPAVPLLLLGLKHLAPILCLLLP